MRGEGLGRGGEGSALEDGVGAGRVGEGFGWSHGGRVRRGSLLW